MNSKALLVVALALVALQLASAHPVKRSCACNLKGTEVCGCIPAAAPRPVRPRGPPVGYQRVVYQKFAPAELKPQDVCTCAGGLVTAPEIPRVPCKVHSGPVNQAPNYGFDHGLIGGGSDCGDAPVNPCEDSYAAPAPVRTYVIPSEEMPAEELIEEIPAPAPSGPQPADAVSLALAYEMATRQQKNIREENLAFGHMQVPKDGRIITKKRIVPEAGLYAVRNQIVELKPSTGYGRSCDDEAEASLMAAQQSTCGEEETGYGAPLPSYRDLGFAPVGGDCKFVPGQYQPAPQVVETVEYNVRAPRTRAGPVYTPCDALATVERGRGNQGTDYYGAGSSVDEEVVAESDSPSCGGSGSSYESERSGSYESERSGSFGPRHSGRPGCSCGCGY